MQGDIFGIEVLYHGSRGLVHQLLSQAKAPVGTLHSLREEGRVEWELGGCVQLPPVHLCQTLTALLTSEVICPWGTSSGSSSLEEKVKKEPGTGGVYQGHLCTASVQFVEDSTAPQI